MKTIRRMLVSLIGIKSYLKLISKIYMFLTNWGFLKSSYPELFFLDKLIKPNWVCIDIGANLGYYSNRILKNLKSGHVHAVEPIPLFAEIWQSNIGINDRVSLHRCALGDIDQQVKMSIPIENGVVRHGLTKVDDGSNVAQAALSFNVDMKRGDALFGDIQKVDFIKIDVEGYEQFVLQSIKQTITSSYPFIQIELGGDENRRNSYTFLTELGYSAYKLHQQNLHSFPNNELSSLQQDLYFVHKSRKEEVNNLLVEK
jgi:FkbM family methyltransferase